MTITAKIIAHSRVPGIKDLVTMQCRYPRFIHAEFMTHRVFSRNASSSRAIPIERMIQDVIDDPAMPVSWGSNRPGMQAGEECTTPVYVPGDGGTFAVPAAKAWLEARDNAVEIARAFNEAGYHKQIVNRLLEPFGHISVVVTSTEWENFFALRCHPAADPTMRALAEAMKAALEGSTAQRRQFHLPYVMSSEERAVELHHAVDTWPYLAMLSAARCARVSYLNHDGSNPDPEKDMALAKRLLDSKHMSPFEHQGVAMTEGFRSGNFWDWMQHRQMVEGL